MPGMSRERLGPVLIVAAVLVWAALYFTRDKMEPVDTGVPFAVPESRVTVRFPGGPPVESDLALALIDPDRPGGTEMTALVRKFQSEFGTIRGWTREKGEYRYAVVVH